MEAGRGSGVSVPLLLNMDILRRAIATGLGWKSSELERASFDVGYWIAAIVVEELSEYSGTSRILESLSPQFDQNEAQPSCPRRPSTIVKLCLHTRSCKPILERPARNPSLSTRCSKKEVCNSAAVLREDGKKNKKQQEASSSNSMRTALRESAQ